MSSNKSENLLVPDLERWDSDEPIIELESVSKTFGDEQVLDDLSIEIPTGKITVIIGTSGSGKSVLLKHMNGLHRPDSGTVRILGKETDELTELELDGLRKRIGTLFQNYALIDSKSVVENVAFPLVENHVMSISEAEEHAAQLLTDLDLGDALEVFPASLSGGMKKRVSLARAIIANPEVVLFDEPTTGLDPIMMEFVDGMIQDLSDKYGFTSVIISHDIASVFRLADKIAVLRDGRIVEEGTPDEIRHSSREDVQSILSASQKTDIDVEHAADTDFTDRQDTPAIQIQKVEKSFGDNHVLHDVNLTVPRDKITVIIGGSGAGKSVIMKHILGLFQPDSGEVRVLGENLANLSEQRLRQLRTRIGMLFQHSALFDSMSIEDNIAFPLLERWLPDVDRKSWKEIASEVDGILEQLKIQDLRRKPIEDLSSGQRKRVALGRALITGPELIIYDEPTTGQDPLMAEYIEDMIRQTQESYDLTSVIISHDMAAAFRLADHIALLHKGSMIASGPPKRLLESEDERVRRFIFASEPEYREKIQHREEST
jgi:ABC-type transporter Mla maintaining outer membrane lipid asymmetry ATPase subunit MlaF